MVRVRSVMRPIWASLLWPCPTLTETLIPLRRERQEPKIAGYNKIACQGWFGPDLSPLVVHRHTDDLSDLKSWLLRRAETEMVPDLADSDGVGDVGNDLERATAAFCRRGSA